jgi:hypothetical protein
MASPTSTPPLYLHLHEFAMETAAAMRLLELRTLAIAHPRPAARRAEREATRAAA